MTIPEPDITVDVDLRNPGQFFACCGVLELASRLWPGSEGWFGKEGERVSFCVAIRNDHSGPLVEIVRRLCAPGNLAALAGDHDAHAPDRKPVVIVPFNLRLDWWLDSYSNEDKSELKVWAGRQRSDGKINDLCNAWRALAEQEGIEEVSTQRLFSLRWPMKGRLGIDPSAAWESLHIGFSPDEQDVPVQTCPATEVLAAIGLQRCRPAAVKNKRRWFAYHVWADPVEIAIAPAAVIGVAPALGAYEFPVIMRNSQYGSFGRARPLEDWQ